MEKEWGNDVEAQRRRGGLSAGAGEEVGARDEREGRACFQQWTDKTTDSRGEWGDDGIKFREREQTTLTLTGLAAWIDFDRFVLEAGGVNAVFLQFPL